MNPLGNLKHGQHGTLTYRRWKSMRQRAAKTTGPYAGIECCSRWASFEAFFADMGECPEGHTLDRIENSCGYEPSNCRWATVAEQNGNRSSVVMISHAGACKSVANWARDLGISANIIRQRIYLGWDEERALTTPVTKRGDK